MTGTLAEVVPMRNLFGKILSYPLGTTVVGFGGL
jgi:hypothetical protein